MRSFLASGLINRRAYYKLDRSPAVSQIYIAQHCSPLAVAVSDTALALAFVTAPLCWIIDISGWMKL
jgi:hypothetical protein